MNSAGGRRATAQPGGSQSVNPGKLPDPSSGNTGRMFRKLLILLCLLTAPAAAGQGSPLLGMPLLQRYTSDDYPALPTHYSMVSDARGLVYLGNTEGLLIFDGRHWELLELPLKAPARALALGADGRVYVGSYDHFGVIEESATGERRYVDLRPRFDLGEDEANLAEVWDVLETPSGLYFRAAHRLLFLGYDGRTRHWPLPPDVRGFSAVDDRLYARVAGGGLMRWSDGRFEPEPQAERFAERPLFQLFPRPEGRLLVSDDGFHLASESGIRALGGEAPSVFAQDEPYTGIELPDGSYALGTFGGQVLWFSSDLRLRGSYAVSAYTILGMGLDREGGLWLATEGEAVRLRLPSPWTRFGPEEGLNGGIYTSAWYEDALWVATSIGVLRAPGGGGRTRFDLAIETHLEATDMEATSAGLLVTDRSGLLWLRPGQRTPERLLEGEALYTVTVSERDERFAYAIGEASLHLLQREGDVWRARHQWPLDGLAISSLHEPAPGELWVGNYRGWPQRWWLDRESGERRIETLDPGSGLDLEYPHGASLVELDGRYYALTGQRAYRWDGERFLPDRPTPLDRIERLMETSIVETAAGSFAYTSRELWFQRKGTPDWVALHTGAGLSQGFAYVHGDADGLVRIATWSGLLQFDPSAPEMPKPALRAGLRRLEYRSDARGAVALPLIATDEAPTLPSRATLSARFGLVSLESAPEFRYRIEGLQGEWSDWSSDESLALRELPAGRFRLEVEARTRSGRSAESLSYAFSVDPLWWETRWARGLGVLLALASVIVLMQLSARWRLRRYAEQTRRLEQRIAERTAELQEANRRLAEMATIDSLTGVPNRRALEQGLAREWQRCLDTQRSIAAVMIDIDHFKQFNDRYGHLEGDEQLRWVGGELRALCDPTRELLARFGGEEFALILPGADLDAARARAQAIHSRFTQPDSPISLSIGVAATGPIGMVSPDQLLRSADAALYEAKRKGRNRVEAAA